MLGRGRLVVMAFAMGVVVVRMYSISISRVEWRLGVLTRVDAERMDDLLLRAVALDKTSPVESPDAWRASCICAGGQYAFGELVMKKKRRKRGENCGWD